MKFEDIKKRIMLLKNKNIINLKGHSKVHDYSEEYVSEKILKIIYSYTDYVNRETWKKL